jgi:predicted Zn-dependent protease
MSHSMRIHFKNLGEQLFSKLLPNEEVTLSLEGEESQFLRFSNSKVRQATSIEQWNLIFTFKNGKKKLSINFQIGNDLNSNLSKCFSVLETAREESLHLLDDPFVAPIENFGTSYEEFKGSFPNILEFNSIIKPLIESSDLAGILATGPICRGILNSKGVNHWYQTEYFSFDYSIYFENRAVKACYAGKDWVTQEFREQIEQKKSQLNLLKKEKIKIKPGTYRCYLAPSALADVLSLMNWGGFSFGDYKRGNSPLGMLYENKLHLSEKVTLLEDFSLGYCRRFNADGELSPEKVTLIQKGKPFEQLTSTRSSLEYSTKPNGANEYEHAVSLNLHSGNLKEKEILNTLGSGLYLSNIHYLNWSDRRAGRFTGMTRFACFWVENGKIVGPIEDLRFDENVYDCLGEKLVDLTEFTEVLPETHTYGSRHLGAKKSPGAIINDFVFTL